MEKLKNRSCRSEKYESFREMASLKDFIPNAQFHESNGDFEKAIEVYTKGIDSLQNDTSNTWRLYWSRAGLKIKLAQGIFEKAGKSTETEWELQQKLYTEAEYDLKQAIKGQESNARNGSLVTAVYIS